MQKTEKKQTRLEKFPLSNPLDPLFANLLRQMVVVAGPRKIVDYLVQRVGKRTIQRILDELPQRDPD